MSDPVRLYAKQSAWLRACGSCALFSRERNDERYLQYAPTKGNCGLKFPPWMKLLHNHVQIGSKSNGFPEGVEYAENSTDWTRVDDSDTCDFWRASGLTYVKDQTWSIVSTGGQLAKE